MTEPIPDNVSLCQDDSVMCASDERKAEQKMKLKMLMRRIPKAPTMIILALLMCSVFSKWIAPHDPTAQDTH